MESPANYWPTPEQLLLLTAGLCPLEEAREAWIAYCARVDIQKIEYVSITMLPLVFRHLPENYGFPVELQSCKSMYRHTWVTNNIRLSQCAEVLKLLHEAEIQTCLLKGAALIIEYYRDAGLRVMGDIDILVPKDKAKAAIQLLIAQGWAPQFNALMMAEENFFETHHAMLFSHANGQCIDLHWSLLVNWSLLAKQYWVKHSPFFPRQKAILFPQTEIPTAILCAEDQALHILLHGMRNAEVPLIRWIPDIAMVLKHTPTFDWNYFFALAQKMNASLLVKKALLFLRQHHFANISEAVIHEAKAYPATRYEKEYLRFKKQENYFSLVYLLWCEYRQNHPQKNRVMASFSFLHSIKIFVGIKYGRRYWLEAFRRLKQQRR